MCILYQQGSVSSFVDRIRWSLRAAGSHLHVDDFFWLSSLSSFFSNLNLNESDQISGNSVSYLLATDIRILLHESLVGLEIRGELVGIVPE